MSPTASKPPSHQMLPPNYQFSVDDPFYYGPATCELMHYKKASIVVVFVEFIFLITGCISFWRLHYVNQSLDQWAMIAMIFTTAVSTLTTFAMFYGLFSEQPRLIVPKMAIIQIEIGILMFGAAISILAMSLGIGATAQLFGIFVLVPEMERDFGPIWPFNISVVAFFASALCMWILVIVRGAYDFLLDKEFFQQSPVIEMAKTLPQPHPE